MRGLLQPREEAAVHGAQQPVHQPRQQRDPDHVGQDHVHGQVAAHEEDAIAQAGGCRNRFSGNEEQPRGPQRQAQRDQQARQHLRQGHAQHQGPAVGPQRLRLDQQFGRDGTAGVFEVARQQGRDTDDDQHHLGQFIQPHDDEEDRQDRQRRHHRDHGQQRREPCAQHREDAVGDPQHETGHGRDAQAQQHALQAGQGIAPEQVVAGARVFHEGHVTNRIDHLRQAGQELVIGVVGQARGRAEGVQQRQDEEGQERQQPLPGAAGVAVQETHGAPPCGKDRGRDGRSTRAAEGTWGGGQRSRETPVGVEQAGAARHLWCNSLPGFCPAV
jgi:hypothetical protein